MDDPRLEWLSCVLKSSINVPKKAFLKHLNTDRNEDAIDDFFNARIKKNPENELEDTGHIFFWATKRKITKTKTIEYEEEVTDDEQPEEDERPTTTENNETAAAGDSNTSVKSEKPKTPEKRTKIVTKTRIEEYEKMQTTLFMSVGFDKNILKMLSLTESRLRNGKILAPILYLSHRDKSKAVPIPQDLNDATLVIPDHLEYGTLTSNSLQMLDCILSEVYVPIFNQNQSEIPSEFYDEIVTGLNTFLGHTKRTIQQLDNEIRLDVPNHLPTSTDANLSNVDLEDLESVVASWQIQISTSIEEQTSLTPTGRGPMAEIEFWCERKSALSALAEQLKLPKVENTLQTLQRHDSPTATNFKRSRDELVKLHIEANENVRFLSTLERHFKNLAMGSTGFGTVIETIPTMMNSIRMVWIISRHYNKDERMVPLMERIAWALCDRVRRIISIKKIFKQTPEQVKEITSEAELALRLWRESYMDVREQIEKSNRDPRWEFDKKKLFEHTDYIANICADLYKIAQVSFIWKLRE